MQQPRFFRTSFNKKTLSFNTYRYISQVKKNNLLLISLILHGNWQKKRALLFTKIKTPVHHIQQSYSYEIFSKNVDHEFQNPAAIFYSFLHDFFNLYLTKDSTALLEDNTLNQCINYFFFWKLTAWRKTLIYWKMKCGKNGHLFFKLYETEVGSRHTQLRRKYDKWLLRIIESIEKIKVWK